MSNVSGTGPAMFSGMPSRQKVQEKNGLHPILI